MNTWRRDGNMSTVKRLTANERYQLMSLGVAAQILDNASKEIEPRVRMVKNGWRDLRLARAVINGLLDHVTDTLPTEQLRAYANALHDASFTVGVRCSAVNNETLREREHAMYVSLYALGQLGDTAREHCMMCGLDAGGRARCPLRKALDELPNNAPDGDSGGCPYYGVI